MKDKSKNYSFNDILSYSNLLYIRNLSILLRWILIILVFILLSYNKFITHYKFPYLELLTGTSILIIINIFLTIIGKYKKSKKNISDMIFLSLIVDIGVFLFFYHFMGGIESEVFPIFLISLIIIFFVLNRFKAIILAILLYSGTVLITILEKYSIIKHYIIYSTNNSYSQIYTSNYYIIGLLTFWFILIILTYFFIFLSKHKIISVFIEMKHEEEKTKKIESLLDEIILSLPVGLLVLSKDNKTIKYNKQLLNILNIKEPEEIFPTIDTAGIYNFIDNFYSMGTISDLPYIDENKNKKILELKISVTKNRNKIIIFEDITYKREQEEKNKEIEMNMMKNEKLAFLGQMSAGIAHELNNPLTNISSYGQLLKYKIDNNKGISKDDLSKIDNIILNAERISRLIKNLLTFSKKNDKKETININNIIEESIALLEFELKKKNISIDFNLNYTIPLILFNRTELEEIFVNLITNAIQFLDKEEKTIKIQSDWHEEKDIEFTIEDNGQGIDKDKLDTIFEPFYTSRKEGTGLGLSIISNILEKYNGKIIVTSTVGVGTRIVVRFPPEIIIKTT